MKVYPSKLRISAEDIDPVLRDHKKQLEEIQYSISNIQSNIKEIKQIKMSLDSVYTTTSNIDEKIAFSNLKTNIDQLNDRLSNIEEIILEDPIKALNMIIIKNDLKNLQNEYSKELFSIRTGINRVYDINK